MTKDLICFTPFSERPWSPEDVLAYYDGPLIFVFSLQDKNYLCLAVGLDEDGIEYPVLMSQMNDTLLDNVKNNNAKLRDAILECDLFYYCSDYTAEIMLLEAKLKSELKEEWLPGNLTLNP